MRDPPLLILNLGLDIVDGIGRLNLKRDSLAGESLDEDLHDDIDECAGVVMDDRENWSAARAGPLSL